MVERDRVDKSYRSRQQRESDDQSVLAVLLSETMMTSHNIFDTVLYFLIKNYLLLLTTFIDTVFSWLVNYYNERMQLKRSDLT